MAIQRWEMLLSAQENCYLLKIQGDRADVDQILRAHPDTCPSVQEISEDIFQWVIFVMDAPLSKRLAIQNQVMSLTVENQGGKPSDELLGILDGLSSALQDLTNLTEDEQAFVMNKMARLGNPATASSAPVPPAAPPPAHPPTPPESEIPPAALPPKGQPLPRVNIPGRPGLPPAPAAPPAPTGPAPLSPARSTPLPPVGPIPSILRPAQPPRTPPAMPKPQGTPLPVMPSIPLPKTPPMVTPISKTGSAPTPPAAEDKTTSLESMFSDPPKGTGATPGVATGLSKPPLIEPLAYVPSKDAPPQKPDVLPISASIASDLRPATPSSPKAEENPALRISFFYPTGQETAMNHFLNTLTDVAQKKSRRPTAFQVALSVPTSISLENSTEWIWKSKTSGSDIFFVILPDGMGSETMDPLVGEAQTAGLRCFIVPNNEISSKLLYMDLMVELMMFKKRVRPTPT